VSSDTGGSEFEVIFDIYLAGLMGEGFQLN
jgi:hypothetical protein